MRTFGYVILLFSIVFQCSWTYVLRGSTHTGLDFGVDSKKFLMGLLQTLTRLQNEDRFTQIEPSFPERKNYGDGSQRFTANKRDMGVLPPWNELCRMMKISYCRSNS